jgi:hypothetical protein
MQTRQGALRLLQTEFQRLAGINIDFTERPLSSHIVYRPLQFIMAEKTVANIISKNLELTSKYSGKSDQNVDEWLKDLTAKFNMADMSESQALKIIPTFLDGPVKEWFNENKTTFDSWGDFKVIFLKTYASPATKQLASHRLRTRQQSLDEPIIEYYTDVIKLCKIVDPNMTDACKIDHLCHGLKSSLLREVLRHAPSTPAEFLEHATHEEVLDCLVNTSLTTTSHTDRTVDSRSMHYDASLPQFSAVNSSSSQRFQNFRPASNTTAQRFSHSNRFQQPPMHHLLSSPPSTFHSSRSRLIRCFNCNKPGHIARDCWSTKNY